MKLDGGGITAYDTSIASTFSSTSLSVGNGTGLMNGTATLVQLATKSDNVVYNIPFASSTTGSNALYAAGSGSSALTYNPSTLVLTTNNIALSTAANIITSFSLGILTIECNNSSNREFNFPITGVMSGLTLSNRRANGVYKVYISNSSGSSHNINSTLSGASTNRTSYTTSTIATGET